MKLVWRAAIAMAEQGLPVLPWAGGPVDFPSTDPEVVGLWARRYPEGSAALDLAGAHSFALTASNFGAIAQVFEDHQWWPPPESFTMQGPSGSWSWLLRQPVPRVGPVNGPWGKIGLRIETEFHPLPGATEQGGAWRLEAEADIRLGHPPEWLTAGIRAGRAQVR